MYINVDRNSIITTLDCGSLVAVLELKLILGVYIKQQLTKKNKKLSICNLIKRWRFVTVLSPVGARPWQPVQLPQWMCRLTLRRQART